MKDLGKSLLERLCKSMGVKSNNIADIVTKLEKYLYVSNTYRPIDCSVILDNPSLYYKLIKNSSKEVVYVILELARKRSHLKILKSYLKKLSLGFDVQYTIGDKMYRCSNLRQFKSLIPSEQFSIIQHIYITGLIYKDLLIEMATPKSKVHFLFLERIKPTLSYYENVVMENSIMKDGIEKEEDFLDFYLKIFQISKRLNKLNKLNEAIKSRLYLNIKKSDYSEIIQSSNTDISNKGGLDSINKELGEEYIKDINEHITTNHKFVLSNSKLYFDFVDVTELIFGVYNNLTAEYLTNGFCEDEHSEYFIENHRIVSTCTLPYISKSTYESIRYVGAYIDILRSECCDGSYAQVVHPLPVNDIRLQSHKSVEIINKCVKQVNDILFVHFIEKFSIKPLAEFLTDIFLFRRIDFIENLFEVFRKNRNLSKKNSISFVDDALSEAFRGNNYPEKFKDYVDILVDDVAFSPNQVYLEEPFSLICKLDHPLTIVIPKTVMFSLVKIFKFLWKLKKIEHLLIKLKPLYFQVIKKYFLFIYQIQQYVLFEVIEANKLNFDWDSTSLAMDLLSHQINGKVKNILNKLFLNKKNKPFELIFYEIETALIKLGVTNIFNDDKIIIGINNFINGEINIDDQHSNQLNIPIIVEYLNNIVK